MARSLLIIAFLASPLAADPTPLSPNNAVQRMKLPPGFSIRCVAHEPLVQQPISMSFDHRGRLWVLQYLQYPEPAGLVAVKRDQFLRTTWDRVPEPPPKGPRGADKLTILHDPDEHGVFTKSTDVITGLNLASGFCLTNTGVYVLQAPYLLYYSLDGDNVMGDPKVVLTGFGNEDSHALANSLQFGPDGWLYGAQGSTVTAKIKNPAKPNDPPIEFQQGIWRYHPDRKIFELFAEGGGNIWGLDFDKHGQLFAGTNFGGVAMMHVVQGGYYVKNFAKHGPLHNPYAYGYYEHVPYKNFKGGHVTCGGIIYQGGAYPKEYEDQYIACNPLANDIYWHKLTPAGSSFTAEHGGELVKGNDPWFRPIDLETGPDGCVYVADWYDKRLNHVDPVDNWHKTSGRIYRIEYGEYKPVKAFELKNYKADEVLKLLKHPNNWWRRIARRELISGRHDGITDALLEMLKDANSPQQQLESIWVLNWLGDFLKPPVIQATGPGIPETLPRASAPPLNPNPANPFLPKNDTSFAFHAKLYADSTEPMRCWIIRLFGDAENGFALKFDTSSGKHINPTPAIDLQKLATAKRLKASHPFSLILLGANGSTDRMVLQMAWWALEADCTDRKRNFVQQALVGLNNQPMPANYYLRRQLARYCLECNDKSNALDIYFAVMNETNAAINEPLLKGIQDALFENSKIVLETRFIEHLTKNYHAHKQNELLFEILTLANEHNAIEMRLQRIEDRSRNINDRAKSVVLLRNHNSKKTLTRLIAVLEYEQSSRIGNAIYDYIVRYDDIAVGSALLKHLRSNNYKDIRTYELLASRTSWSFLLLSQIELMPQLVQSIPNSAIVTMASHKVPQIDAIILKHYGKVGPATAGEKQARIASVSKIVREGAGDAVAGKALFKTHCGTCHKLHGEGESVGPELTGFDRQNLQSLLLNVVDPSAVVRPEYVQQKAVLSDGRVLLGIVVEQQGAAIVLVDAQNRKHTIPRGDLEKLTPLDTSLMPEKLLDTLSDQQLRDLFKYLQSNTK